MKIKLPEFKDKAELYKYLIENKTEILELKKSAFKEADGFGQTEFESKVVKNINKDLTTPDTDNEIQRTVVGNTYLWLDSHEDVHVPGCFAESIKQRGAKKISHLHDHIQQLDAKVGQFTNVYEKQIPWLDLGVNRIGETESLMGDSTIKRSFNSKIFDQYKAGEIDQHSVGMFYVDLKMAINDPDIKEAYAEWQKWYPKLGNPEKAAELGYFYVVYAAKLREISCVLAGSNEITPTLSPSGDSKTEDNNKQEPADRSFETNRKIHTLFI